MSLFKQVLKAQNGRWRANRRWGYFIRRKARRRMLGPLISRGMANPKTDEERQLSFKTCLNHKFKLLEGRIGRCWHRNQGGRSNAWLDFLNFERSLCLGCGEFIWQQLFPPLVANDEDGSDNRGGVSILPNQLCKSCARGSHFSVPHTQQAGLPGLATHAVRQLATHIAGQLATHAVGPLATLEVSQLEQWAS
jgi:hypothetical protein